jgi:folate-binding protein YgfZ
VELRLPAMQIESSMSEGLHQINTTGYTAVRNGGAGVIDLSSRGRLLLSGSEAVTFLNGLITNDMKTLAVNSWMPAAFPNVQGRLLAAVRIIHREDGFLIDTEAATQETVWKLLERFTLAGDFRVANVTGDLATLSVQGKKAAAVIRTVLGDVAASVERQQVATAKLENDSNATIIRATHTAEDGFDLFVNADQAESLRDSLISAGAHTVASDIQETLRIEGGLARYGIDMDETNVVTETNLDEAVSFIKGCYLGQEIIARIKYRGHVAKKLTGLTLEGDLNLERGARILSDDEKEIGRVTSATLSPSLARTIALGYVKYDYLAAGTKVKIVSGEKEIPATVTELPFVRGSWYAD